MIQKKLVDKNIFTSISVDVKVLNWSFSILGEVNKPGKYFFDDENLNLFEALGIAGDLTINGKRNSDPCMSCNAEGTILGKNHAKNWEKIYNIS